MINLDVKTVEASATQVLIFETKEKKFLKFVKKDNNMKDQRDV